MITTLSIQEESTEVWAWENMFLGSLVFSWLLISNSVIFTVMQSEKHHNYIPRSQWSTPGSSRWRKSWPPLKDCKSLFTHSWLLELKTKAQHITLFWLLIEFLCSCEYLMNSLHLLFYLFLNISKKHYHCRFSDFLFYLFILKIFLLHWGVIHT